jgi:extracellular elastinolytic metalloproteinase
MSHTAGEAPTRSDLLRIQRLGLDALGQVGTPEHLTVEASGPPVRTSAGAWIVYARESLHGVPIVRNSRSAVVSEDGEILNTTGRSCDLPEDVDLEPEIGQAEALHRALAELFRQRALPPDLSIDATPPERLGEFGGPSRGTVLRKTPIEDPVLCRLVLLPGSGQAALRWEVRVSLPEHPSTVLVPAHGDGAIDVVFHRHGVHLLHMSPADPDAAPLRVPLPPPAEFFPGGIREPSPSDWVTEEPRGARVVGNNARIDGPRAVKIRAKAGPDGVLVDTGDTAVGAAVRSALYWSNYLRDFFDRFGFGAAEGAMQERNPAGVPGGGDALEVLVVDSLGGTPGEFTTKPDGSRPTLRLFRHRRHAALDPHVVIHEYAHGVVNRLIDGREVGEPLHGQQPEALGEGFCDYFAVSLLNWCNRRYRHEERWGFASWCTEQPAGLRSSRYQNHPGRYADLANGTRASIHHAGEVWAATLLDLHEHLRAADPEEGESLAWRVCVDALRALHAGDAGPHFVHAAKAWRTAFDRLVPASPVTDELRQKVEDIFADRGLGRAADSAGIRFVDARPSDGGGA